MTYILLAGWTEGVHDREAKDEREYDVGD